MAEIDHNTNVGRAVLREAGRKRGRGPHADRGATYKVLAAHNYTFRLEVLRRALNANAPEVAGWRGRVLE